MAWLLQWRAPPNADVEKRQARNPPIDVEPEPLSVGASNWSSKPLLTAPVSTMSVAHKTFTMATARIARSSVPRVLTRSFADKPYPFTKPAANAPYPTPRDPPTSQYPFTNPSQLTKVAPPSGAVEHPGPNPDPSPVISKEAEAGVQVADGGHLPDYSVAENYTTSYVEP